VLAVKWHHYRIMVPVSLCLHALLVYNFYLRMCYRRCRENAAARHFQQEVCWCSEALTVLASEL